jgi:hypothetical protein
MVANSKEMLIEVKVLKPNKDALIPTSKDAEAKKNTAPTISIKQLFSNTSGTDVALMVLG